MKMSNHTYLTMFYQLHRYKALNVRMTVDDELERMWKEAVAGNF